MKYLKLLLMVPIFMFSCGEATPEEIEENTLHESLYAVHDEVMPEMSTINRISRGLRKVKESTKLDSLQRNQFQSALTNLEKADEGMMDWMHNYKKPSKWRGEKTHEEIMDYLNVEMEKISSVKQLMESSIKEGQTLLDAFEK